MNEGENSQSNEFVKRVDGMSDEEVNANFYDLMSEAVDLHPEDKTQWSTLSKN